MEEYTVKQCGQKFVAGLGSSVVLYDGQHYIQLNINVTVRK